jgi:Fe2+ or Zn2+ uptake regulation protein
MLEASKEFPHDLDLKIDELVNKKKLSELKNKCNPDEFKNIYQRLKNITKQHVVESLKRSTPFKEGSDYIKNTDGKPHKYFLSDNCFLEIKKAIGKRDNLEWRIGQKLKEQNKSKIVTAREIKESINNSALKKMKIEWWVDIFTNEELIEIKRADEWKDGIGEVLSTKVYFKDLTPHLHLFTIPQNNKSEKYRREENKQIVEEVCEKLGIKLTWHHLSINETIELSITD